MKKNLLLIILVIFSTSAISQQINRLSNYFYNQLYFNPAASGMYQEQLNVSALNKFQWSGIKGAPMLSMLTVDYKTLEREISAGLLVDRYSMGATKKVAASVNPCYSVLLGYKLRLAMGLRLGFEQLSFNPSSLDNVFDNSDELLGTNAFQQSFIKIGGGFQLRSTRFHLGLSSTDLFISDKYYRYNPDTLGFFKKPRNFILNSGYRLLLNDSYAIIPTAIAYIYKNAQTVAGAGAILEIKDYFWLGGNYYTNSTASVSMGTYLSSRIRFVYSYELWFSGSLPSRLSSHEVNLLFKMDKIIKKKK